MLEEYKSTQPLMYKELKSNLETLSHAYLFNLNENVYAVDMVNAFVKSIICTEHKTKEEYEACSVCKRIDDGNYGDLKKIYPDGMWIKKESLDELQKIFSTKSIESNKRVYIIYDAEKLNKASANSLLKFLEEPLDGIIAILLTNNINQVLDTIVSRCRILTFTKNNVEDYIKYNNINKEITLNKLMFTIWKISQSNLINDENRCFVSNVLKFIEKYEASKIKMIMFTKNYFHDIFIEKEDILKFFQCLILFYRDVLMYKTKGQVMYYDDYISIIQKISIENKEIKIIHKLDVIIKSEKLIRSNVNINLLIDSMIIDMEGNI